MQMRFEYKYKVPDTLIDSIRKEIQPFLEIDPFANKQKNSEYVVRSIYLDNLRFSSYFEKIEGLPYRNKFRIRGYNEGSEDSTIFLEIKRKSLNNISKTRVPLSYNNLSEVLNEDRNCLNLAGLSGDHRQDAQSFLYYYYRNKLQPVILIVYNREAWAGRFDCSLRLTFDKNIRSILIPEYSDLFVNEELFRPAMKDYFVLEFKFYSIVPVWFKQIVREYNLVRSAISKYTICIDSHLKSKKGCVSKFNMPKPTSSYRLPVLMMRSI